MADHIACPRSRHCDFEACIPFLVIFITPTEANLVEEVNKEYHYSRIRHGTPQRDACLYVYYVLCAGCHDCVCVAH